MLDYTPGSKGNYRALGLEQEIILLTNTPWKGFFNSSLFPVALKVVMVVIEPVHLDRKHTYWVFGCYLDTKHCWILATFISSV